MCGGEQVLGVKGGQDRDSDGDPDGSRDGTLPLAGRFRSVESAAVLRFFGGL